MARERASLKLSQLDGTSVEFRQMILLPGTYVFDEDPLCRYDVRPISGTERTYVILEVQDKEGRWIDVNSLTKWTVAKRGSKALEYVNSWVREYSTIADLALALAGSTLVVSNECVDTYTTYKGGEVLNAPVINGKAYKATLTKAVTNRLDTSGIDEAKEVDYTKA
jgi:hypothetical protein